MTLDLNFLNGMIKTAAEKGCDPEKMAYVLGRLSILTDPNVRRGFDAAMSRYGGPVKKSSLAIAMQPSILAEAVEHVINEGCNPICDEMRAWLPEHQELTERFEKAAAAAGRPVEPEFLTRFERMKLSDKLALLGGVGAGIGGAYGLAKPSMMDQAYERGPLSRSLRGALTGAGTATGAGLGAMAGNAIGQRLNPESRSHPLAMLLGAGVGGMAGHQLSSSIL